MGLIRITAPDTDPVTLEEVKEHLHVDSSDEDARIADFIRTATQKLDGRYGLLGRCLISQTWDLILDRFPARELQIPLSPIQSITSVIYSDRDGVEQTVDPTDYVVDSGDEQGWIVPLKKGWPSTLDAINAVRVRFVAGFGDDPEDVPEPLRTAIKMHVGHLHEHRESVTLGSGFITTTPHGYDDLIRDYRVWSF